MKNSRPRYIAAVSVATMSVVALASACSSTSNANEPTSSTAGSTQAGSLNPISGFPAPAYDAALAKTVPEDIRKAGTLIAAVDATAPPKEFLDTDNKTFVGLDVDMVYAVGNVLGIKMQFTNSGFDTLIPGVQNGRFQLVNSSAAPTLAREKVVDFVSTDKSGEQLLVKAGSPVKSLDDLCGLKAGSIRGSLPLTDLEDQSKKCTGAGKPQIDIMAFPDNNSLNLAVSSGRADAALADQPNSVYQASKSNGTLAAVGPIYRAGLEGMFTKKDNGLAAPLAAAMNKLREDGTYAKMLAKWNMSQSNLDKSVVNPASHGQQSY